MALTAQQQQQYNQLVAAGASSDAAMNAVQQIPGQSTQTPTQTSPTQATPAPAPATAVAPTTQTQQAPQTSSTDTSTPPTSNLSQGSSGADVQALQKYLIQTGYLTADQVAGGQGIYGPKTTAAVAQLQKDLGVNAGAAAGAYGPQTQQALAQKYQGIFNSLGGQAPNSGGAASAQIQSALQAQSSTSTDPVFGSIASSLAPIMSSLTQVMNNINNPALTGVSLQQEYNDLQQQYGLPKMQSDLLNMQNVMNGTDQDIRDEITKAGGTATESQVMGMTAARNNVILKQYNALATQYQAAQTNVQNLMQYATSDQATQLQKEQITASVAENMASIEGQMFTMAQTMQKNTADNLNKIVTNVGYQGLASQAQGNPQMLSYYENSLGLAPGSLSNPSSLSQLETLRQQQVALGAQKVQIQMYNAGMGVGGVQPPITPNPAPGGASITQPYTQNQLVRPSWLDANVPLVLSQAQMDQYKAASNAYTDPGTNNVVAPKIGYYVQQSDGSYVLNSSIPQQTAVNSVDSQYQAVISQVQQAQASPIGGSPLNKRRLSMTANAALKNYTESTVYKQVSNAVSYLARVKAAMQNPGSISDTELADAIVKINTGGGQVTEAQINTYFQGQSYADKFAVQGDKIVGKGGVLSPQQRKDLSELAQETFTNYETQYEQLYVQAAKNLEGQGIPLNFLSNIPNFTEMLQGQAANVQ